MELFQAKYHVKTALNSFENVLYDFELIKTESNSASIFMKEYSAVSDQKVAQIRRHAGAHSMIVTRRRTIVHQVEKKRVRKNQQMMMMTVMITHYSLS